MSVSYVLLNTSFLLTEICSNSTRQYVVTEMAWPILDYAQRCTVKSEWTDCRYFVFGSASLLYIKCGGIVRSF